MKKNTLTLLLLVSCIWVTHALDVSLSYATFKSPKQKYIEVYLHVVGQTVTYLPIDGDSSQLQAAVEVTMIFKKTDKEGKEEIVKFDKFKLNSPIATERMLDFVDLKRYALRNGKYMLEVEIKDVNKPEIFKKYSAPVRMLYRGEDVQQSDVQLLASFEQAEEGSSHPLAKNGVIMEPLPYNFYGRNADALMFYNEIYDTDKAIGDDYMVSYFIEQVENNEPKVILIGHKRKKPAPVTPILLEMDIKTLPSGNYNLVVEVRNRHKELISKKSAFFQRSNPFLNVERVELAEVPLDNEFVQELSEEDLKFSLRSLTPQIGQADIEFLNTILAEKNYQAQRLFLFSYWIQKNPNNPKEAFDKYTQVATAVNNTYRSGFRYGFETDRGFYFLKYGKPHDIVQVENDPSAPPYEIWTYNEFPQTLQNNVKFIFYNPSLAPGDFVLLHSTARGELNNPRWEVDLYKNAPNQRDGGNFIDGTGMQDGFNRNASRFFRDY